MLKKSRNVETSTREMEVQTAPATCDLKQDLQKLESIDWSYVSLPPDVGGCSRINDMMAMKAWEELMPWLAIFGEKQKMTCVLETIQKRKEKWMSEDSEMEVKEVMERWRREFLFNQHKVKSALYNKVNLRKASLLNTLITKINASRAHTNRRLNYITKKKLGKEYLNSLCKDMRSLTIKKDAKRIQKEYSGCSICSKLSMDKLTELLKEIAKVEKEPLRMLIPKHPSDLLVTTICEDSEEEPLDRCELIQLKSVLLGRAIQTLLYEAERSHGDSFSQSIPEAGEGMTWPIDYCG